MKRILMLLMALVFLAGVLPVEAAPARRGRAAPPPPRPPWRAAIVADAATGAILFEKHADEPLPPASLTKVLSLYLAFEAVRQGRARWRDPVRISRQAWRMEGSRMFLDVGTDVSLGDLVLGTAIVSANDAALAVAEHLGGTEAGFVAAMNARAQALGMSRSHFANPHGLPAEDQFTTARDMLRLTLAYLSRFPAALTVHARQNFTYNGISQRNRNRLLRQYPGADGVKTGYICESGYNLIATARRGNTRLVAVVLGATTPVVRARETIRLLDEGFARMGVPLPPAQTGSGAARPPERGQAPAVRP
ncbi:MAG TPA: D-alanyl-D-alanine carboxypeptidase family protein [Syntrophales bacterium]|nr:D-alanyl-D-alanine carboxypeptidase family protein [Syntrophales bacterium]